MLKDCRDAIWFEDYRVGDEFQSAPVPSPKPTSSTSGSATARSPSTSIRTPRTPRPSAAGSHRGPRSSPSSEERSWRRVSSTAAPSAPPGIALEFKRPVRPGDTLVAISRVLETRPSATRPDRGYVRFISEAANQSGDLVVTLSHQQIMQRRPAD